jgi:Vacuolar protein sorting-associated protein 62
MKVLSAAVLPLICVGCGGSGHSTVPTPAPPISLSPASLIPAPISTARPVGAEPTIALTTPPAITSLALRFQPTVKMSMFDRFWPVSVAAVLNEYNSGRHTCLVTPSHACGTTPPTLADLHPDDSPASYLQFPQPLDKVEAQFTGFERGLGVSSATLSHWRENPVTLDPYASAQIYFYDAHEASYTYRGIPPGLRLTSLQYWFFYPLNYYPTIVNPLRILSDPLHNDYVNSDYHEGDWEHITVLIDSGGNPRYLWMARHSTEGIAIPWSQVSLDHDGHPIVYPALGGHPSYPNCGAHWRALLLRAFADFVPCNRLFSFSYATTPLVDLSHVSWACWPGHFGAAGRGLRSASNFDDPTRLVLVAGPLSPLRQAENARVC